MNNLDENKQTAKEELERIRSSLVKETINVKKTSSRISRTERSLFLLIGVLIAFVDYISKTQMQSYLAQHNNLIEVTFFLNFVSVFNTGAAFGIFADYGTQFLAGFSLVFCVGLYIFTYLYPKLNYLQLTAIAFIFGGGLGNGFDRILKGSVFDFIDLHLFGLHWPAFNIADAAVVFGVCLAIYSLYKEDK